MSELMVDIKSFFDSINFDETNALKKWFDVIKSSGISISDEKMMIKLCVFVEKYSRLEDHINNCMKYALMSPPNSYYNKNNYPSWYIPLIDVIKKFSKVIDCFMTNNSRFPIKCEFYNIITNKKGIELTNGIIIEDGNIIKNSSIQSIYNKLNVVIDREIDFFMFPEKRKLLLRKEKLDSL
ncbi:hypothetical protein M0Q50_00970 [bacterium]|jgi:hypothetical protein|nr:hypothetical protein [bacterium]